MMSPMQVTFLGCGSSSGVPMIGCTCGVCLSDRSENKRLRSSLWVRFQEKSFLIDTTPDFRWQALQRELLTLDAVLITHTHADHIHGMDELRRFHYLQKKQIPVYATHSSCKELEKKFRYLFQQSSLQEGKSIPALSLHPFSGEDAFLEVQGVAWTPLSVQHGWEECIGYRLGSFAYVTDCNEIALSTLKKMEGLHTLILDCLCFHPHRTHFHFQKALETIAQVRPQKTYLTHLGHEIDYHRDQILLPPEVFFAYDGLTLEIPFSLLEK
jgi:phosphoribosyl 1,2-cyclic phosphate phosphodiesterase